MVIIFATYLASIPSIRHLRDNPNFSSLVRAHKESSRLVKRETCRSETIVVPDVGFYLPTFAYVDVAHDVNHRSLAGRSRFGESVFEVNFGDFVTCRAIPIPRQAGIALAWIAQ